MTSNAAKNVEGIYALAPQQQGMLLDSLLQGGGALHVGQFMCTLRGPLDPAAFAQAWATLLARHAILRTAFVWEGRTESVQVVLREVATPLTIEPERSMGRS